MALAFLPAEHIPAVFQSIQASGFDRALVVLGVIVVMIGTTFSGGCLLAGGHWVIGLEIWLQCQLCV